MPVRGVRGPTTVIRNTKNGSLPARVLSNGVLLHLNTEKGQHDIPHVYLREAGRLRPDLSSSTYQTAR